MKGQQVVHSRGKDDWETPKALFAALHEEFHFTLDGAADETNHLLPRWLGPGGVQEDALASVPMGETVFCNPPYSKVREFVTWAAQGSLLYKTTTVLLIPARTDTRWFHAHVWDQDTHQPYPGVEVRFLKGRLKFLDAGVKKDAAPFPSMIVVFR